MWKHKKSRALLLRARDEARSDGYNDLINAAWRTNQGCTTN